MDSFASKLFMDNFFLNECAYQIVILNEFAMPDILLIYNTMHCYLIFVVNKNVMSFKLPDFWQLPLKTLSCLVGGTGKWKTIVVWVLFFLFLFFLFLCVFSWTAESVLNNWYCYHYYDYNDIVIWQGIHSKMALYWICTQSLSVGHIISSKIAHQIFI